MTVARLSRAMPLSEWTWHLVAVWRTEERYLNCKRFGHSYYT